MNNKHHKLPFFLLLTISIMLASCVKEPDVIVDSPTIVSDDISWVYTNIHVTGEYQYTTTLKNISIYLTSTQSYDEFEHDAAAEITDNTFKIILYNITDPQDYYYYYKLTTSDGFVLTPIKPFIVH